MKAIRIHEFGGPEVMKLEEADMPVVAADEILLEVYAASVNPADYIIREGGNDLLKPYLKLPMGLGLDAAGIVAETGSEVTAFKKGDKVYGTPDFPVGAYSEFFAAKASQFALMPHTLRFNEAGALPACAAMAWNGIIDLGRVQAGQHVFIHGAAGGIGSLAIQIAKWKGAYVTGTASAGNTGFLKQLGADEVIDYKQQRFEELLHDVDMVFNTTPVRDNDARIKAAGILKEGGIFVCTHLDNPFSDDFLKALAQKNITGTFIASGGIDRAACLKEIARLIDDGKVKVIVSKVYPLAQAAEAHRESEQKHVRGKLVLEVKKENENK